VERTGGALPLILQRERCTSFRKNCRHTFVSACAELAAAVEVEVAAVAAAEAVAVAAAVPLVLHRMALQHRRALAELRPQLPLPLKDVVVPRRRHRKPRRWLRVRHPQLLDAEQLLQEMRLPQEDAVPRPRALTGRRDLWITTYRMSS